jgi:hypothetical protein
MFLLNGTHQINTQILDRACPSVPFITETMQRN